LSELTVINHQNQRVLTTQQIAKSYGTDPKTISYNFNHNAERYTEGKHFYLLEGPGLRAFREIHDLPRNINRLYLWTEKGAWLHAKSLGTDKAWDAYEMLVDDYYRIKDNQPHLTPTEALLQSVQRMVEQERQIKALEENQSKQQEQLETVNHRVDTLDAVNVIGDQRQRLNGMVRKYARTQGIPYNKAWGDFVQAFNTAYHTNLTLLKTNYQNEFGKQISTPEYLAISCKLEDALRVADKMLNRIA